MLRPRQPFDTRRLPVVASPDVAASAGAGGALELSFGGQVVHARLVAEAQRFPTTQDAGDSFVLADESSLASALGADDLPASIPGELWLSTPAAASAHVAEALRKPPFAALDVSSRSAIHADLQSDPIARGIVSSLVAAALAALALALLGVALATMGFLRDEGDSLFDLESQGAGPRALRACVRWRALGLALLGVLAGVALGIGLAVATGRLLAVDATLAVPDPPLQRITPWLTIAGSRRRPRNPRRAAGRGGPARRLPARRRRAWSDRGAVGRMTGTLALELRDVFRIHADSATGAVALQGMTLSVERGERCVVLGPSGSGKSSLLRIAAGFDRPSAGVARTLGVDVMRLGARRAAAFRSQQLGFLDQHYARALSPALSCADNVALPLALGGVSVSERRARALELLDGMGLADRADDPPAALSGGEQQRVAACAALAHAPALLLADEPAGELDGRTARTVYRLLGEMVARSGTTLVIVSHDEAATDLADRVVHVRDGRISGELVRGGSHRLVVGRGGWVRLPESARDEAGIGGRASWRTDDGRGGALRRRRGPRGDRGSRRRGTGRRRGRVRAARGRQGLRQRSPYTPRAVGLRGRLHARPAGRRRRAFRLGQDDAAAPHRGPGAPGRGHAHRRRRRSRRARPRGAGSAPPRSHRLGRSGAGPRPVRHCARERAARPGDPARRPHAGARARGARVAGAPRPGRLHRARGRSPLGGGAPAGRDRACARPAARRRAAGRADRPTGPGERRARRRPAGRRRAPVRCGSHLRDARRPAHRAGRRRPAPGVGASPRRGRSCGLPRCRAAPRPCRRGRPCPCPARSRDARSRAPSARSAPRAAPWCPGR